MNRPYASDLTPDWSGFCALWKYVGAHLSVYGHPPHYRKTADFLANGGFIGAAIRGREQGQ